MGIEELDYVPSENYSMLGHQTAWGNRAGSPSSKAAFTFSSDAGEFSAQCELRSARNAGISITGQIPSELTAILRGKNKFFSAYIPGISGIPNREEKRSKKVVLKACSYGDSNVILRNVLLLLKQQGDLATVEEWIGRTVGNVKLFVDHDEEKSLVIDCSAEIDGLKRPIELIGTGYLQLIQLFSYILLFRPGILLVDEPDIHLHPSVQEKLVQTLADVAKSHEVRILLTTHSPFIVRGAPSTANVYWVQEGRLEDSNRAQVELALGWGAFGKKILVISEDTNTTLLRQLIAQWPQIDRQVTFYPGTGFKNLPTPDQVKEISAALGGKFQVLVHRDRDSLTDDESKKLTKRYTDVGADLWLPAFSDVEGYFCQPSFLAELAGCTQVDAEAHIADVNLKQAVSIKDQFASQRAAHNQELYTAGGSPTNDDVWNGLQAGTLKGAKGKFMLKQLKNKIGQTILSDANISAHKFKSEIGTDLREKLEAVLKRA